MSAQAFPDAEPLLPLGLILRYLATVAKPVWTTGISIAITRIGLAIGACLWLASFMFRQMATCMVAVPSWSTPCSYLHWFSTTDVALFGPLGFLFGQLGWYANLTGAVLAALAYKGNRSPRAAVVLHMLLVVWAVLPIPMAHYVGPTGTMVRGSYGAGFWCWFASELIIGILAAIVSRGRTSAYEH